MQELMPHLSSLVKDLFKISENIVVKKPDEAYNGIDQNDRTEEMKNLEYYNAYKNIRNGTDTYMTYTSIPDAVLNSVVTWNSIQREESFFKERKNAKFIVDVETCDPSDVNALKVVASNPSDGQIAVNCLPTPFDIGSYVKPKTPLKKLYISEKSPDPSDQMEPTSRWVKTSMEWMYTKIFSETRKVTNTSYEFGNARNVIPDGDYRCASNIKSKCVPYFSSHYIKYNSTIPTRDGYGSPTHPVDNKIYLYDEIADSYYLTTAAGTGEFTYKKYNAYGFYILNSDDYILNPKYGGKVTEDNVDYVKEDNANDFDDNGFSWQILSLPMVRKYDSASGKYIYHELDGTINPDEWEDQIYYKCISVKKYVELNDAVVMFENSTTQAITFTNITDTESTYNSVFYFDKRDTGLYNYDGTSYHWVSSGSTETRYQRVIVENYTDRYKLVDDEYVPATDGNYTYVAVNKSYWMSSPIGGYNGSIINIPEEYRESAVYNLREYVKSVYCPDVDRKDYRVSLYRGEKNPYYRTINGLPKDNDEMNVAPKIDRLLVDPTYTGKYKNPYVFELTDNEVEIITKNGMLDSIKKLNPSAEYLNYLGANRIDIIKAREANSFDILRMGDIENASHINMFIDSYQKSKDYITNRYYQPEMFGDYDKYIAMIGFMILSHAVSQCLVSSNDILIYDDYIDNETINLILKSYGYEADFGKLPVIIKKMIAKNINMLIKYRGSNAIYDIIYNLCGVSEYNVFKYNLSNNGDLNFYRKLVTGSAEDDYKSTAFSEFVSGDSLWKEKNETYLETILPYDNPTKYIGLETCFDLSELALNNSYILNYILDCTKYKNIEITVPGLGTYPVFDLIVGLFAAQSIKFGYNGLIPTKISTISAIHKFNIEQAAEGDVIVKDLLKSYREKFVIESKEEQIADIDRLLAMLDDNPSVILPDANAVTMRSISDGYFATVRKDSPNTNLNENSFYQEVLLLKSKAKSIDEYQCYSRVLEIIAESVMTETNFIINPVWDVLFKGEYVNGYTECEEGDTGALKVVEDDVVPGPGEIHISDTGLEIEVGKYVRIDPEYDFNKYINYVWSYDDTVNRECPQALNVLLYNQSQAVYYKDVEDKNTRIYGSAATASIDNLKDASGEAVVSPANTNYYLKANKIDNLHFSVILYKKCYSAITYNMYLKYNCPEIYKSLFELDLGDNYVLCAYDNILRVDPENVQISKSENGDLVLDFKNLAITVTKRGTGPIYKMSFTGKGTETRILSYEDYQMIIVENADKIYKLIISALENSISGNFIRQNMVYSIESSKNIAAYIELLVDVFKAYNVGIHDSSIRYTAGETGRNSMRIFDTISFRKETANE